MNEYKLDQLHYYKAPGPSWDALLKRTIMDLELLTDVEMHLFIEKGMVSKIEKGMVSKRHAKANNHFTEDDNPEAENRFAMYYEAKALYGWAVSQPLYYSGFVWRDMRECLAKTPKVYHWRKPKGKGWIL